MPLVMHTSTLDHYASNAGKYGGEFDSERDLQDYLRHYQDLRDEWKRKRQESTDITDDVVFEIELIRQIEINIDYILMQPSSPLKKLLSG